MPHLGQGVEHGVLLVLLQRVAQAREYQHAHAATLSSEQSLPGQHPSAPQQEDYLFVIYLF